VTLTIPKDGYTVDLVTGAFKAEDPAVQADLAHPERPTTAIGYLVAALDRRRRTGLAPFSVLSCATTAVMSDTDSTPRGEQGQSLASKLSSEQPSDTRDKRRRRTGVFCLLYRLTVARP